MSLGSKTDFPQCTLIKNKASSGATIYELELHNRLLLIPGKDTSLC